MSVNSIGQTMDAVTVSPGDSVGNGSNPTPSGGSSSNTTSNPSVTENQFLQLLVTQLKNQDPLNPTNSDQFMGELAQFSQLQEVIGIHQDLNSLLSAGGIQQA